MNNSNVDESTKNEQILIKEIRELKKDNEMLWKYIDNEMRYKQMQIDDLKPKPPQKIQIFSAACTMLAFVVSIIALTLRLLQ